MFESSGERRELVDLWRLISTAGVLGGMLLGWPCESRQGKCGNDLCASAHTCPRTEANLRDPPFVSNATCRLQKPRPDTLQCGGACCKQSGRHQNIGNWIPRSLLSPKPSRNLAWRPSDRCVVPALTRPAKTTLHERPCANASCPDLPCHLRLDRHSPSCFSSSSSRARPQSVSTPRS